MPFIYKYKTYTHTPLVKQSSVLNLDIQNVFYIQLYVESAFMSNPGSTIFSVSLSKHLTRVHFSRILTISRTYFWLKSFFYFSTLKAYSALLESFSQTFKVAYCQATDKNKSWIFQSKNDNNVTSSIATFCWRFPRPMSTRQMVDWMRCPPIDSRAHLSLNPLGISHSFYDKLGCFSASVLSYFIYKGEHSLIS